MPMLKQATVTAAVALCTAFVAVDSAKADVAYGGGSTLASVVYRALMDKFYSPLVPGGCGVTATDIATSDGLGSATIFYAAEGSGAGRRAFENHNGGNVAAGLGTATPGLPPPYTAAASCTTSPAWAGYPFMHYAGTDDPVNATDIANYNANSGPTNWGKMLDIPTFITPIVLAYNPAGLNTPASGLNLTRKMVCGLMSGHITNWADPIFATSGNGGGPLTTTSIPITFVHRADGSGHNFLFTNALRTQCSGISGPTNAFTGLTTPALWEMSWTDRTVAASQCPAIPARGTDTANWPDLTNDQCGTAIPNTGSGAFDARTHTDQVACGIMLDGGSQGGIGYNSPDFAQPVRATLTSCTVPSVTAPLMANVQNQYSVDNDPPAGPFTFITPTATAAQTAMATSTPTFATDAAETNPLNWTTQGLVPNPDAQAAYPISGFTWMMLYQCYNESTAAGNVLGTLESWLQYFYGGYNNGDSAAILNANGFATVPAAWGNAIAHLAEASSARFGVGGSGVCSGIPGA